MKQYLSREQTAKLIELGFEKPKTKIPYKGDEYFIEEVYSIGELIEMLPTLAKIKGFDCFLNIEPQLYDGVWDVGYMRYNVELNQRATELIDALYAMILQLKEEGVI